MLKIVLTESFQYYLEDICDDEAFHQLFLNEIEIPRDCEAVVHASGTMLSLIQDLFQGLPRSSTKVVTWTGDHAMFIIRNLINYAAEH